MADVITSQAESVAVAAAPAWTAEIRKYAVEAIGAIGEPKAIPELRRIWQSSNDLAWNAAAIRAPPGKPASSATWP